MCRWVAYSGTPVFLSELLLDPPRSLVAQSLECQKAKTLMNADGVGLAWYGDRKEPGLYREILPAWSDCNLVSLSRTLQSGLFFGHVRASTGTQVNRMNCHPFTHGRWSFMHNGQIGDYSQMRRGLEAMLPADLFAARAGTTDSELLFLLALAEGLETSPQIALERAIGRVEALARGMGLDPFIRASIAVSNGQDLWFLRYATDRFAPSLFVRENHQGKGIVIASEPLDDEAGWQPINPGVTQIERGQLSTRPFGLLKSVQASKAA